MKNAINWFEIPVKDIEKSKKFYETILDIKEMEVMEGMGMKMAMFPFDKEQQGVGGGLSQGENYEPSKTGSLVYLNGGEDLNVPLSRVEQVGGKIVMPKTAIGENGFIAIFEDIEGNHVAFHSIK